MSIFRRPTRAAGYSWRKWEDPIVYRTPTILKFHHLAFWALFGASFGALTVLFGIPAATADPRLYLLADMAAVALGWIALVGLFNTWNEMSEYAG